MGPDRRLGRARRRRRPASDRADARPHRRSALEDDPAARRQPHEARPERTRGAAASTTRARRPRTQRCRLGLKPYPAQKLYAQVRNFSAPELDDALIRLAELDHALKGGSRLAGELELERALVEITERRVRPCATRRVVRPAGRRPGGPPATSCARRRSGAARRARRPGRSAARGCRCSVATAASSPSATAAPRRFVSVLIVER